MTKKEKQLFEARVRQIVKEELLNENEYSVPAPVAKYHTTITKIFNDVYDNSNFNSETQKRQFAAKSYAYFKFLEDLGNIH